MGDPLLGMYRNTRKLIDKVQGKEDHEDIKELYEQWTEAIDAIETACPGIKEQYDRHEAMVKSFSREQIDFICYQIGDWYCEWENKMWVDGKPNQHWLGVAKEQLKTLICGE